MSYILFIALVAVIIYHVIRIKQLQPHNQARRPAQEPAVGLKKAAAAASQESALYVEEEPNISEVRIIRKAPTAAVAAAKNAEADTAEKASPPLTETARSEPASTVQHPIPDIIVLHLFAETNKPYRGYELLQSLLTAGLRYGKKGIFHRYEEITGRGDVVFSLASASEPGTFDLPKMGSFSTKGLVMFMRISQVKNAAQIYDMLLSTAKEIVDDLGGSIYDELRKPLTQEKILQWRSHLRSLQVEVEEQPGSV